MLMTCARWWHWPTATPRVAPRDGELGLTSVLRPCVFSGSSGGRRVSALRFRRERRWPRCFPVKAPVRGAVARLDFDARSPLIAGSCGREKVVMVESGGSASVILADRAGQVPLGIGLGVGAALITAAAFVAAMVPSTERAARFTVVAAVVGLWTAITVDWRVFAGVAVTGALISNGFLENPSGNLSWHESSDWELIAFLVAMGTAGLLVGATGRYLRRLRSNWHIDAQLRAIAAGVEREEVEFDA